MANQETSTLTGTAYWAQVLPDQLTDNYAKDGKEWSVDVGNLSEASVEALKALGLGSKIKDNKDYKPYISFRRAEIKKSGPDKGKTNQPIRLIGPDGVTTWPENLEIGNGSEVMVKFSVNTNKSPDGRKTYTRADILSLQVRNHVPFIPKPKTEFPPVGTEAPVKAAADGW